MSNTFIAALLFALWLPAIDLGQAEALIDSGHLKRAKAMLEPAYKANPKDARTAYLLSRVREAYGDLDAALQLAEEALALDAKSADYHYQVAATSGQLARKANMFKQAMLARRVKKEAEIAMQLDPKHIDSRALMVTFYLEAPGIMGGDKQKARELAAEIARIDPVEGASAALEIARNDKDNAAIEAAVVRGAQAGPQNYDAQMTLANYYANDARKKDDLSEQYAKAALKIDASRVGAYSLLVQLYIRNERWNELETILVQAEKNVPDNLNPHYQAARILLIGGRDLPRAEIHIRKYLAQEPEPGYPNLGAAHWRLGLILEKLGRKQEAISELEKAVQMNPTLADAKKDLKRVRTPG